MCAFHPVIASHDNGKALKVLDGKYFPLYPIGIYEVVGGPTISQSNGMMSLNISPDPNSMLGGTPVRVAIVALSSNCSNSVLCSSPSCFRSNSSSSLLSESTSMRCTFPLPIHVWLSTQGSLQLKHNFFLLKSRCVSSVNHSLCGIILSLFSGRLVDFSLFSGRLVGFCGGLFFGKNLLGPKSYG